jgi:hypothetical protein
MKSKLGFMLLLVMLFLIITSSLFTVSHLRKQTAADTAWMPNDVGREQIRGTIMKVDFMYNQSGGICFTTVEEENFEIGRTT